MSLTKIPSCCFNFHPTLLKYRELNVSRLLTIPAGVPGQGAGKGGGGGGSVREGGGGLGRYGAAQEEGYFYGKTKEQLEKIKREQKDEAEISQKKDDT